MADLIARAEALEAELRGTFDRFDANHDGEWPRIFWVSPGLIPRPSRREYLLSSMLKIPLSVFPPRGAAAQGESPSEFATLRLRRI